MRALALFALGACAEPAVEMSLKLPTPPAGFDVSCVTSISTVAIGNDFGDEDSPPDQQGACIDVQGMTSFAEVQRTMAGKFEIAIPQSGLLGIEVRGSASRCDDFAFAESVFYGAAPARGDSVEIPIVANLSCNTRGKVATVHPVDLMSLAMTKTCPVATEGRVFSASFRPVMLGSAMPAMTLELGASASSMWTAGSTKVEVFAQAASPKTCVAVGFESLADVGGARCIEDALPTLCAPPGELELPTIQLDYSFLSREPALVSQYGEPLIGAAWEIGAGATKVPIAGATVTLDDPTQGTVVYVDRGLTKLTRRAGTVTGPDGFFMVYTKGTPTTITVTGPSHAPQKYKIATSADYPATLIAALTRR